MDTVENIWETASGILRGLARTFERSMTGLFGTSNARYLKRLQPKLDAINALEPRCREFTATELKEQTDKFRKRLADGETLDDLLIEAFAVCREAGRRVLGMRHFDVQLLGAMVLHYGNIAEMATGEGKTLVATLPAYLNAIEGKGVHVVTVNDYLARRDMEWMGRLFMALGLSVGTIERKMDAAERQEAYRCDITYGTNNEFGFDYLRDNMRPASMGDDRFPKAEQQCQRRLHHAILDEVDSILIDEARTPLIISGPACDDASRYTEADRIVRQLDRDVHFEVNEEDHVVFLIDNGIQMAERLAGVESFYTANNMEWPHFIDTALKAHHLYRCDVDYVVKDGKVVIVDQFTGRLLPGRNWREKYATRLDVPDEQWNALAEQIEDREQMKAEGREVARMGGLHVIGTERHEARRIDLQLRGRSGRQGDAGSSRFFLSLEDDLMRVFGGEWVQNMLARPEVPEGRPIETPLVSRRIEEIQKKIEQRNFATRRRLLEYDEVMNEQRTRVYGYRQRILDGADCKQLILEMIGQQIEHRLDQFLAMDYGTESFAQWAGRILPVTLTPRNFCGMEFDSAETRAKDKAIQQAEGQLLEAIAENPPEDIESGQCNWEALAQMAHIRWKLRVQEHDLRKVGREELGELLVDKVREAVQATDLSRGARFFQPDFGIHAACDWLHQKFGIELNIEKIRKLKPDALKECARVRVEGIYSEMEERSRGETQRIERRLVLQVLDAAWKDHLLALDRLRSSVRLRSYARVDPIVEYKREGMRMFSQMWDSVGERITDQVFRRQHVEQGFVGSLQTDDDAMYKDIPSPSETSEHE